MIVMGLGYSMRNGKDTVARTIKEEYGSKYEIKLYSFAKSLKEEVNHDLMIYGAGDWSKLFSYYKEYENLPDWVKLETDPDMTDVLCPYGKQRNLLQWWGMNRRHQDPNYWIKKVNEELRQENPTVALVTDVRLPNEYWWVKSFGREGITIKVERIGYENKDTHISETALDGYEFDYTVSVPNDNLHQLKKDSIDLFELIKARYYMPPEMLNWNVQ